MRVCQHGRGKCRNLVRNIDRILLTSSERTILILRCIEAATLFLLTLQRMLWKFHLVRRPRLNPFLRLDLHLSSCYSYCTFSPSYITRVLSTMLWSNRQTNNRRCTRMKNRSWKSTRRNWKMKSVRMYPPEWLTSFVSTSVVKSSSPHDNRSPPYQNRCSRNCSMADGKKECLMMWRPISFSILIHYCSDIFSNNWDKLQEVRRFVSPHPYLRRHSLCDRSTGCWRHWVWSEVCRQPMRWWWWMWAVIASWLVKNHWTRHNSVVSFFCHQRRWWWTDSLLMRIPGSFDTFLNSCANRKHRALLTFVPHQPKGRRVWTECWTVLDWIVSCR